MSDILTKPEKIDVQYPYRAIIRGKEHIVKGWRDGNLLTNKGEFAFSPLFEDNIIYSARILEVFSVQSGNGSGWLFNGYNHRLLESMPAGSRFSWITDDENL